MSGSVNVTRRGEARRLFPGVKTGVPAPQKDDFGGSSTAVSTYVTYLRRKLASDGPDLIHTQRAAGYGLRLPRPDEKPGWSR
jgi:Transcriptional regulatory protein, C terminal